MTFGAPGTDGARVHDIKDVEAILDVFRSHGHTEVRLRIRLGVKNLLAYSPLHR